jgi:hypothetical protein
MAEQDARFEDAAARPLRLRAETVEDLAVIAAVLQDAVGKLADVAWMPRRRRFALVLNRFRWEEERRGAGGERVRCGLNIDNVMAVKGLGVDPGAAERIISLLEIAFEPGEDGAGRLRLLLAGGGEIALEVEALELSLQDLSQPWQTGSVPSHDG